MFSATIQCDGQLDWKSVGSESTAVNLTVPTDGDVYQMAVSANLVDKALPKKPTGALMWSPWARVVTPTSCHRRRHHLILS